MRLLPDLGVYLVLDRGLCAPVGMAETARLAVAGGATVVQLRDKDADTDAMVAAGREIQAALAGSGALFVVNDDVEAARILGADGLHIGQDDMSAVEARARIGAEMILGLSVETVAAARAVDAGLVDYVGAGPVFATGSKPDHKPPVGFDGLAAIVAAGPVPAVAIGGVKARHVTQVFDAGCVGLAVVSEICGRDDPRAAARVLADAVGKVRG